MEQIFFVCLLPIITATHLTMLDTCIAAYPLPAYSYLVVVVFVVVTSTSSAVVVAVA